MLFDKKTDEVIFLHRPNRFQAWVRLGEEEILAHVPNTGRLKEILIPGCRALVRHEDTAGRKSAHSLIAAWKGDKLINFDTQAPNKVVEEALLNGQIPQFSIYDVIAREKTFGRSRFDFRLTREGLPDYYLEVKGVTLEEDGIVSFPDAVTERGAKHLQELAKARQGGYGAGLLFLVQLENARCFIPNTRIDPLFSQRLSQARDNEVDILAYTCKVTTDSLTLAHPIPVIIEGETLNGTIPRT